VGGKPRGKELLLQPAQKKKVLRGLRKPIIPSGRTGGPKKIQRVMSAVDDNAKSFVEKKKKKKEKMPRKHVTLFNFWGPNEKKRRPTTGGKKGDGVGI